MKVRMDFVTNSSSAGFILARSAGFRFNEKQKKAILRFVRQEFLGEKVDFPDLKDLSDEDIDDVLEDYDCCIYGDDEIDGLRDAAAKGYDIYAGTVSYDSADEDLAYLYNRLWTLLEKYGDGNFIPIQTDLDY